MEYRKLGRTELDVGVIGLGTEHLEHSTKEIDHIVNTAVEEGVNYVDVLCCDPETDPLYREGLGPALRAHRSNFILGINWGHPHDYLDLDHCRSCFESLLASVGNGYAEVAKLMMVDTEAKWDDWGRRSLECLQRYREQGKVGHIGISGHNGPVARKAVDSGLVDVLMYPFNLSAHEKESDRRLVQACADKGIGFVAMKPYGGGALLQPRGDTALPKHLQCLHYVLSHPVSTLVAGAKNAAELRQTLSYFAAGEAERDYRPYLPHLLAYMQGECTYCNHCLPCPVGIDVGRTIFLGDGAKWALQSEFAAEYAAMPVPASACTECGTCTERCPFGVEAAAKVRRTALFFEN